MAAVQAQFGASTGVFVPSLDVVYLFHYTNRVTNYEPIGDWRARINGMEHGIPHVHVQFRDGSRVVLAIETGALLAGRVRPVQRLAAVRAWIADRRNELLAEYRRLNP
ncbi:putative uncharacterized protein [Burkholderiales bacterium GJ-E10]|nr:putative uncharacterized protein [Burkholderiales bacterium GJ-E10]